MNAARKTVRAYVELARLSNLPTCFSNVLVGCAIGGLTDWSQWQRVMSVTVAIGLMYITGMALNDALDHAIDRKQRPNRPIPSGRISVRGASTFAGICIAIAIALLASLGMAALLLGSVLAITIILYDWLHKKFQPAALLMGCCRGLVYITAAFALAGPIEWTTAVALAGALTVYISIVTFIAQTEVDATSTKRNSLALVLPIVLVLPAVVVRPETWSWAIIAAFPTLTWLILAARLALSRPPNTKNAILTWLSGICLIDAFFLTLLDQPILALGALGCFVLTAIGHRYILGT